jgi:large subunit ribosomal protein L24
MISQKIYKIRLKKGDTVVVRSGKYKGKMGKIVATHPTLNKVTVEGINIVKKHVKPNKTYPQGGIIEMTKPIAVSKVGIQDPTSKKPSKIGYKVDKDGKKTRVLKRTGKEIK